MGGERASVAVSGLIAEGKLYIGDGYRAKNEELAQTGLPFARAGNIDGGFRFEGAECFPEMNLSRVGKKVSEDGDVVFTSKGTVGRFAFVRPTTPRFVYSPQLCFWRVIDRQVIDPRYLFYWMHGPDFYAQFKGVASQTDMADYVSLSDQRRMNVRLPKLCEQRAIAIILGALDDKIDLTRRMSETLEAMARALFKSWFVDFDPVRAKAEGRAPGLPPSCADLFPNSLEDSELGELPQGWQIRSLDETARFVNGLAMQKYPPTGDGSLPVIKIAQLRAMSTDGADRAAVDLDPSFIVNDGDVLFSWSGSLVCDIWTAGRGGLNQHVFKVTSDAYPKWLFYFWIQENLDDFRHIAASKATTMGHIQRHHLSDAKVVISPPELMRWADDQIGPLMESRWRRQVESRSLAALRDTLLPKLISGELRIPDAERIVGEVA